MTIGYALLVLAMGASTYALRAIPLLAPSSAVGGWTSWLRFIPVAMGASTYALRAIPLLAPSSAVGGWTSWLRFIPVAIFAAIVTPALREHATGAGGLPYLVAAAAAAATGRVLGVAQGMIAACW